MKALRVYLLRHGEPADTAMFYGHHDVDLSERGRAQVEGQVRALRSISIAAVYSSDLLRARLGSEAIARATGASLRLQPELREMHLGELEGLSHAEALQRFGATARRSYLDMLDFRFDGGGESVMDVAQRVLPWVEATLAEHDPEAGAVVVYAHNTVNRVVLAQAAGVGPAGYGRFSQRYGAINRIDMLPQGQLCWSRATIVFANLDPLA